MVDKIDKFVHKLSVKEAGLYRDIVKAIFAHDLKTYDVKKLSGHMNVF